MNNDIVMLCAEKLESERENACEKMFFDLWNREDLLEIYSLAMEKKMVNLVSCAGAVISKKQGRGYTQADFRLCDAVRTGSSEMVRDLVELGADVNFIQFEISPLTCAIERGYDDIIRYLLEKGALMNERETASAIRTGLKPHGATNEITRELAYFWLRELPDTNRTKTKKLFARKTIEELAN